MRSPNFLKFSLIIFWTIGVAHWIKVLSPAFKLVIKINLCFSFSGSKPCFHASKNNFEKTSRSNGFSVWLFLYFIWTYALPPFTDNIKLPSHPKSSVSFVDL